MGFDHRPAALLVGYFTAHCLARFWALAVTSLCSKCLGTVQLPTDPMYIQIQQTVWIYILDADEGRLAK